MVGKARIIRSQVRWLGSPEGPFVSSMVLGSKAVDLPYDIRDLVYSGWIGSCFSSPGFQTSLIHLVLALSGVFLGSASWLRRKCFSPPF